MFEEEKKKLINAGIKLDRYGLVALSGGNVTLRMTDGTILVTPSGTVSYTHLIGRKLTDIESVYITMSASDCLRYLASCDDMTLTI